MEGQSHESLFRHVRAEFTELVETGFKLEQEMDDIFEENLTFLRCMVSQAGTNEGPLMPKTPKVNRKNAQRIETIHEDQSVEFETTRADNPPAEDTEAEDKDEEATSNRRSTRTAAKKASTTIKKQQSTTLRSKMRRPDGDEDDNRTSKKVFELLFTVSKPPQFRLFSSKRNGDLRAAPRTRVTGL